MKYFILLSLLLSGCVTLLVGTLSPTYLANQHYKKVYQVSFTVNGDEDKTVYKSASAFAVSINNQVIIATAGHVCWSLIGKTVKIVNDYNEFNLKSVKFSNKSDVCIMETVEALPAKLPHFKISKREKDIQDVHHLGHPAGRTLTLTSGMTTGYSDKASLPFPASKEKCVGENLSWLGGFFSGCFINLVGIDTSIPGAPGSSGSPVFGNNGKVVGIVSFTDISTPGFLTIMPISDLITFSEDCEPSNVINF